MSVICNWKQNSKHNCSHNKVRAISCIFIWNFQFGLSTFNLVHLCFDILPWLLSASTCIYVYIYGVCNRHFKSLEIMSLRHLFHIFFFFSSRLSFSLLHTTHLRYCDYVDYGATSMFVYFLTLTVVRNSVWTTERHSSISYLDTVLRWHFINFGIWVRDSISVCRANIWTKFVFHANIECFEFSLNFFLLKIKFYYFGRHYYWSEKN